jgi:hypothetical protein
VVVAFAGAFGVQAVLQAKGGGGLARALYPPLFAGLWLDQPLTWIAARWSRPAEVRPRTLAHLSRSES